MWYARIVAFHVCLTICAYLCIIIFVYIDDGGYWQAETWKLGTAETWELGKLDDVDIIGSLGCYGTRREFPLLEGNKFLVNNTYTMMMTEIEGTLKKIFHLAMSYYRNNSYLELNVVHVLLRRLF